MNETFTQKVKFNWFFASLIGFCIVLPFSQALVSILGGIVLGVALLEDTWREKIIRFKKNKILLFIPGIFMVYVISTVLFFKNGSSLYDIQKSLFFLIIPIAFMIGKPLDTYQKRALFFAFILAVFVASVIAIINWYFRNGTENFSIRKISLISHIRYSFQLILAFWFLLLFAGKNRNRLSKWAKAVLFTIGLYMLWFLVFQQSLTGLIALAGSVIFYLAYSLFQYKGKYRFLKLGMASVAVIIPVFYVAFIIFDFYKIEKVDKVSIDKQTSQGNYYLHDFDNPAVENGHYTYLYICDDEMRIEWNKISNIKYDEIRSNGYPLYVTLTRYLTSKGLRKDADGIKALNSDDITNIENGISNIIFQKSKFSLYPRLYQTIWEFYMYSKTGDPNYQSFSQRIEFTKAAITIIKQHFWFGVGAGNWKGEFKKAYIINNSKLEEGLYASSHNQYLNYMVKFGMVGLLVILFFIVYPVVKTKSYRDPLFLIFLVFLFFANLADSNFESHMGSSFFVFFYCIFLNVPGDSYLLQPEK